MWRVTLYFIKVGLLVAAAVWLANRPGQVSLDWLGYRIETTVGILALAIFLLIILGVVLWRILAGLRRAPAEIGESLARNRRHRGYEALTQGMVAVAAGDPDEAKRLSKRAERLLEEPPLTMLLSAQSAQLNGDEDAARRYFEAMLEREETAFLGRRGLINQALKAGDREAALAHAREAFRLRPDTRWVAEALMELELQTGDPDAALKAGEIARRHKALPKSEVKHAEAVIEAERARRALEAGEGEAALEAARSATKKDPDLIAAWLYLARAQADRGEARRAASSLEKAWARKAHPDLAELYGALFAEESALERYKRMKKLVAGRPEDAESDIALAAAALEAELWGEARRYLERAGGPSPSERVCRLMAALEEGEHGDLEKARNWLTRGLTAPPDPAWICTACGAQAPHWQASCPSCSAVDTLDWRRPMSIEPAPAALDGEAHAPRLTAAGAQGSD